MAKKKEATIIIKKIKKGGHGHHGGAWKVAYADFVTAMMAFFLLLWLLNATEAEELAGLADYFSPTVGVIGNQGIGFKGGKGPLSEGIGADKMTNKGIIYGAMPTGPIIDVRERIELVTEEADAEKIALIIGSKIQEESESEEINTVQSDELGAALEKYINEVAEESEIKDSVSVVENPEGLEIQIKNMEGKSMFEGDTPKLTKKVSDSLTKLGEILGRLPNYISITGHTSSIPIFQKNGYGNWELSSDRANAARKVLINSGVQPEQIAKVVGKSDNDPIDKQNPSLPLNNRISIVLLRDSVAPSHKKGAPEKVFVDTESEEAKELIQEEEIVPEEDIKDEELEKEVDEVLEEKVKEGEEAPPANVDDPFKGKEESPAPENPLLEKIIEREKKVEETPNKDLFKEEIIKEGELEKPTDNPFGNKDSPAPESLLENKSPKNNIKSKKAPANADLFKGEDLKENEILEKNPFEKEEGFQMPFDIFKPTPGNKNESDRKKTAPNAVNESLFNIEGEDEIKKEQKTYDPFDRGLIPEKLLKFQPVVKKKAKKKPKAVNEDLFEDSFDDEEGIEENPFGDVLIPSDPSLNIPAIP